MIGERDASLVRLLARRLVGQHDIAEKAPVYDRIGGKGQHVGRGILAAPGAVEVAHLGIVGENQGDAIGRRREGTGRAQRRARGLLQQGVGHLARASSPPRGARSRPRAKRPRPAARLRLGPPSAMALTLEGSGLVGIDDLAHQFAADHVGAREGDVVDLLDAFEKLDRLEQA